MIVDKIVNYPNASGAILITIAMWANFHVERNTPFNWRSRWSGQIREGYDNKDIFAFQFFSALRWMAIGACVMVLIIVLEPR
jgi:hypothetical protein